MASAFTVKAVTALAFIWKAVTALAFTYKAVTALAFLFARMRCGVAAALRCHPRLDLESSEYGTYKPVDRAHT